MLCGNDVFPRHTGIRCRSHAGHHLELRRLAESTVLYVESTLSEIWQIWPHLLNLPGDYNESKATLNDLLEGHVLIAEHGQIDTAVWIFDVWHVCPAAMHGSSTTCGEMTASHGEQLFVASHWSKEAICKRDQPTVELQLGLLFWSHRIHFKGSCLAQMIGISSSRLDILHRLVRIMCVQSQAATVLGMHKELIDFHMAAVSDFGIHQNL